MTVQLAIWFGWAQADGANHALRHRSRAYLNHDMTITKHPHSGRVLRTVRHAFAANVLGPDFWASASDAALDAFTRRQAQSRWVFWEDPPRQAPWLLSEPVNLLRCEE